MNTTTFLSLIFIVSTHSLFKLGKDKGSKGQSFLCHFIVQTSSERITILLLVVSLLLFVFLLYLVSVPPNCPRLIFKSLASPVSRNKSVPCISSLFFFISSPFESRVSYLGAPAWLPASTL